MATLHKVILPDGTVLRPMGTYLRPKHKPDDSFDELYNSTVAAVKTIMGNIIAAVDKLEAKKRSPKHKRRRTNQHDRRNDRRMRTK